MGLVLSAPATAEIAVTMACISVAMMMTEETIAVVMRPIFETVRTAIVLTDAGMRRNTVSPVAFELMVTTMVLKTR